MLPDKKRQIAALISVVVSVIVLFWKLKAYYATNSSAILSDALETVANVITSFVALFAVKLADEPADANHPYGHGKAEHFSAAFEGGLVFFAGVTIIYNAFQFFYAGLQVQNIQTGVEYSLIATLLNLVVGWYLLSTGRKEKSPALRASGKHLLSDVVTTAGVLIGLGIIYFTGFMWIDPLLSLLVGIWLIYDAYKTMRINSGALMDETNDELLEQLAYAIEKNRMQGLIDIHNLRMIRSGNFHHIDAHMVVPEFWTVEMVHEMCHEFEKAVVKAYEFDGEFAFHTDPCQQKYCAVCPVEPCAIRKVKFKESRLLTREHMKLGPQGTE